MDEAPGGAGTAFSGAFKVGSSALNVRCSILFSPGTKILAPTDVVGYAFFKTVPKPGQRTFEVRWRARDDAPCVWRDSCGGRLRVFHRRPAAVRDAPLQKKMAPTDVGGYRGSGSRKIGGEPFGRADGQCRRSGSSALPARGVCRDQPAVETAGYSHNVPVGRSTLNIQLSTVEVVKRWRARDGAPCLWRGWRFVGGGDAAPRRPVRLVTFIAFL